MSEPEVATKAPESDAAAAMTELETETHTGPVIPGDTPAQTGPTMGEHCTSDRPTPSGQTSTGEIRKLGNVDVYVSKPADYPHAPSRLLLLLTGGTGLNSTNNQIQADKFASEGFLVVMPDLFGGDPAPNLSTAHEAVEEPHLSFLDQFKMKAAETAKSFLIDMWLARHTEEKVLPILHRVLEACRDEFADAVSHGGGIYSVGYCFGARYVLLLAAEKGQRLARGATEAITGLWGGQSQPQQQQGDEESAPAISTTTGPYIKAGALAHPTMVGRDDFQGLKAPISMVCVEDDPMFPDEVRKRGEEYMSTNNVEHEVQVYPDVPHGFAIVGEYADSTIRDAQMTAFEQMLKWVNDH